MLKTIKKLVTTILLTTITFQTSTIKADNNQLDNRYIKEMKINGKSNSRNYLTHDQLIKGANIQFQMSPVPNKQRGTTEKDRPYSLSFE